MIKPYYESSLGKLYHGESLETLKTFPDNYVETIITDPPYGLEFMGKKWDSFSNNTNSALGGQSPANKGNKAFPKRGKPIVGWCKKDREAKYNYQEWTKEWAKEVLRVAMPGATLLCFGGTRTYHRLACAIEDAGWQIFDCIFWVYGVGFPKSHNISKALTKEYNNGKMVVYDKNKTKQNFKSQMCGLWKAILHKTWIPQKDYDRGFMQGMLEEMDENTQYEISTYPRGKGKIIQVSEGCEKSRLERWSNIQKEKGKIWECEICKMPTGFYINGKKRWLCYGASFIDGTETWEMLDENGMCSSYKSQSRGQQNRKPQILCDKCRTQKIREWEGYGSALKPAVEPIVCARKPNEGSYAENALKWGVSGLNIDGGRIEYPQNDRLLKGGTYGGNRKSGEGTSIFGNGGKSVLYGDLPQGRYPANIILDEESGRLLDLQSGINQSNIGRCEAIITENNRWKERKGIATPGHKVTWEGKGDKGGASRFFYCAKASKSERNKGCEGLEEKLKAGTEFRPSYLKRFEETGDKGDPRARFGKMINNHPTVKPLKLIEYLCNLTKTPTGGTVLDLFAGSGTTGIACEKLGRKWILIEKEKEYCEISAKRIEAEASQLQLFR